MGSLSIRACYAWSKVAFAGLISAAAASAQADLSKTLPDVPRLKFFASSHSTAAAEVLAFHGVKTSLPEVVLIGGLEGRIYRCDCGKGIDLWDIPAGTRLWAAAEGLKVATEAKVLRGPWDSAVRGPRLHPPATPVGDSSLPLGMTASPGAPKPSQARAAPSAGSGQVVPHSDGDRLDVARYRKAIDAGQPVVLTYSLDAASGKGMEASFRSQERVSAVGIGYDKSGPERHVIALLPQGVGGAEARTGGPGKQDKERERFRRLMAMPGVKKGDREGLLLIPWEVPTGNLIATFVTVEEP